MKFKIFVKNADGTGGEWDEHYDKENVTDIESAEEFGKTAITYFNNSLRTGEKQREFVRAEIQGGGQLEHQWEKQNSFTVTGPGVSYDIMKCKRCHITGKRYGLGPYVSNDRQYKAKKFDRCSLTSQARPAR